MIDRSQKDKSLRSISEISQMKSISIRCIPPEKALVIIKQNLCAHATLDIVENEAVERVLHFLEHCKVGKVTAGETVRIKESCESIVTKFYKMKWEEPSCFFTTGFLNGFFSAVKNQHDKETSA